MPLLGSLFHVGVIVISRYEHLLPNIHLLKVGAAVLIKQVQIKEGAHLLARGILK